jgi:hypothetical protein
MTCLISAAAEVDSITLAATSGEVYLVRVAATAGELRPQVRVTASNGATVCQASSPFNPGLEISRCVVTQTGTQTISVSDAAATRTGTYNLYVQRLSSPIGASSLALSETATTVIATGAEAKTFTLTGAANEAFLLRMGVTAGQLRPSLRVFGLDGNVLCSGVQPFSPGAEITRCVLPQAGTYTVLAADSSAVQTGSANLFVQRLTAPANATALEIAKTSTATIQAISEADTYTLTGAANEAFLLRMGVTAGELRPSIRVFGLDGNVLCSGVQPFSPGVEITRCVLPQAGTYTVLATDSSAVQVGSYNLFVQRLSAPVDATPITAGTTTAATLQAAAEIDSYSVQAAANDVLLLRVAITAGDMRPAISVFDPDGVSICAASGPFSTGIELTRCLIPRAGAYLVTVGDTSAVKTGSYSLYAQRLTAPVGTRVIVAGENLIGGLQAPAEADTFRWSAGANDRLRVTVTATGGELRPGVRVFDPAGTKVCEALSPFTTTAEIADCLLPRNGVYTILVGDASATRTGTYRVAVSCLSSPCGAFYEAVIGPEGGQIIAGELQIDIPAGAFSSPTTLQVTPQPVTAVPAAGTQRVVRSFALLARGPGNTAITTAAQPVTYTLRHGDLDLSAQGITVSSLRLALWSSSEQRWMPLAEAGSTGSISATTTSITDVALVVVSSSQSRSFVYLPAVRR